MPDTTAAIPGRADGGESAAKAVPEERPDRTVGGATRLRQTDDADRAGNAGDPDAAREAAVSRDRGVKRNRRRSSLCPKSA